MQINSMNVPPTAPDKPQTYTIVTEWFTLQDVPGPVLDLIGIVLMSIPVPRKYTDPVINAVVQQANQQNMNFAMQQAAQKAAYADPNSSAAPFPPPADDRPRRVS